MSDSPFLNDLARVANPPVDLTPGSKVITRQQLRDPAFYRLVKDDLLAGKIQVVDQRDAILNINGRPSSLKDDDALRALSDSQETWVGKPESMTSFERLAALRPDPTVIPLPYSD